MPRVPYERMYGSPPPSPPSAPPPTVCPSNMISKLALLLSLTLHRFTCFALAAAAVAAPDVSLHSGLRTTDNFPLASILDRASADAASFGETTILPMKYGIFSGRSSLRSLDADVDLLRPSKYGVFGVMNPQAFHRAASILLLLRGNLEASHEVVLGVTPMEIEEGEYAATHPGQTSWADDHPLTTSADIIHASIHRLEGSALGEGNHTGYDNAKYWAMGGPKTLEKPAPHPVRELLADRARQYAPYCVSRGVVAVTGGEDGKGPTHCIIAGGGEMRHVRIPPGQWDDIAYIDICKLRSEGGLTAEESAQVADLQKAELLYLLKNELIKAGFGVEEEARGQ